MKKLIPFLIFGALMSCNQKQGTNNDSVNEQTTISESNNDPKDLKLTKSAGFDVETIPVSDFEITEVKFFTPPNGYQFDRANNIAEYDRLAFFVDKDNYIMKEGAVFQTRLSAGGDKNFSLIEVIRNIENTIENAGGKKVFEGKVSRSSVDSLDEEIGGKYNYDAYGFMGYAKTYTYLIRNIDKENWIQINESDDNASVYIGVLQTKPIEGTAK